MRKFIYSYYSFISIFKNRKSETNVNLNENIYVKLLSLYYLQLLLLYYNFYKFIYSFFHF